MTWRMESLMWHDIGICGCQIMKLLMTWSKRALKTRLLQLRRKMQKQDRSLFFSHLNIPEHNTVKIPSYRNPKSPSSKFKISFPNSIFSFLEIAHKKSPPQNSLPKFDFPIFFQAKFLKLFQGLLTSIANMHSFSENQPLHSHHTL